MDLQCQSSVVRSAKSRRIPFVSNLSFVSPSDSISESDFGDSNFLVVIESGSSKSKPVGAVAKLDWECLKVKDLEVKSYMRKFPEVMSSSSNFEQVAAFLADEKLELAPIVEDGDDGEVIDLVGKEIVERIRSFPKLGSLSIRKDGKFLVGATIGTREEVKERRLKRQNLLKELAASLHLVDPLGTDTTQTLVPLSKRKKSPVIQLSGNFRDPINNDVPLPNCMMGTSADARVSNWHMKGKRNIRNLTKRPFDSMDRNCSLKGSSFKMTRMGFSSNDYNNGRYPFGLEGDKDSDDDSPSSNMLRRPYWEESHECLDLDDEMGPMLIDVDIQVQKRSYISRFKEAQSNKSGKQ